MFDANAPGMTTFRVLYNLEVLSSQLMPAIRDGGSVQSAKTFCEDFLEAGGLGLVVNVLQKDAIPLDVDYETRQGCYAVSLQLLRFLLCGQDQIADSFHHLQNRRSSGGSMGALAGAGAGLSLGAAGPSSQGSGSGPPSLEVTPAAACRAIQTMGIYDFTETVACFMRVTWAAAAGKLPLASSNQPIRESMSVSILSTGSSRSSTGSSASTGSEGEVGSLHPGVCIRQTSVSRKDANIAKEALELLVTCLLLRSELLASFYSLPYVSDFIIDVLVGSPNEEIRNVAFDQFYQLSQAEISPMELCGHQQTPHNFILQTLLKARLPFWVSSSSTRGASFRLLKQCRQYFDLRCRLLRRLSMTEQQKLVINVVDMIEDEIGWLSNFIPSENLQLKETDNMLIAGHLRLIRTLLSCEGINKREIGKQIIEEILHEFLFPASNIILENVESEKLNKSTHTFMPKCTTSESRTAAYQLLVGLADGCLENLRVISQDLVNMHHMPNPETASQWDYMPPVDSRSDSGFVGLRNGGATCYMNSVLQQLYMSPGIPDNILGTGDDDIDEESVLYQVQQIFGHLLESRLQYYVPEKFWKVFKLWGQTVNIREQQDALDFYQAIIDQCDEQVKKLGKDPTFKKTFQGIYSDQKICQGCPHRYEREEVFFALNVTVKNATLQDSLDQFVKGELLEGDNAYFCEKCGEKRNTIKRMCIKNLPPVLCIHLKRFDYDWETNRALKFDDYFKFPWMLDMEPYTAEGMARRDNQPPDQTTSDSDTNSSLNDTSEGIIITCGEPPSPAQINYELVGVVVHSGQANAGHYYSFIKDRRGTYLTNAGKGKWYKFNDTIVEEFDMTEASLEAECFGGKYKAKVYNQATSYPEERIRYWNGYLLFYERVEETKTPVSAKKTKITMKRQHAEIIPNAVKRNSNSLVELTELVHKGEKKGIFMDKMPARIQQMVREENLKFSKNRDVYDVDYFLFMRQLVSVNLSNVEHEQFVEMSIHSLQTAVRFLFNTYFRTKWKLRHDIDEWVHAITNLLQQCNEACTWLTEFFSGEGNSYLRPFLLECPSKEIRVTMAKLLEKMMTYFVQNKGVVTFKCFDEIVESLLAMLNKDVPDNCKTSTQYFQVLSTYVQLGTKSCSHMNLRQGFQRLIHFLLGTPGTMQSSQQESALRRWSSLQARDFGPLHNTLAVLVLNCDVVPYRTVELEGFAPLQPCTVTPQRFLKMSDEIQRFVFGCDSPRYIHEVVLALREVATSLDNVEDMLLYCSFCNENFSVNLLKNIMVQYTAAPSNELRGSFSVLLPLLLLEDPLQMLRLRCIIDGVEDENQTHYDSMLAVIKSNHMNDSRRSYQCIKFLVQLANKCPMAKDYLMQSSVRWQWAVNWLKKKMTEYYWSPSMASVASNDDSSSKSFQRTISAQDTLAEATALLTELETMEPVDMDTGPDGELDPEPGTSSQSETGQEGQSTSSQSENKEGEEQEETPSPVLDTITDGMDEVDKQQ